MNTQEEKPMKLIGMVEFVLTVAKKMSLCERNDYVDYAKAVENYADFLSQPLTLSMFVPVDENGNVLDKDPILYGSPTGWNKLYSEAKDKVLFDGFTANQDLRNKNFINISLRGFHFKTWLKKEENFFGCTKKYNSENLLNESIQIELTKNAKNQIFQ